MERAKLRRKSGECCELAVNNSRAPVAPANRIRVHCLPHERRTVGNILQHQPMQKRGAAAWQTGNEYRLADGLATNLRRSPLLRTQAQQVGKEPNYIPSRRDPPNN